MPYNDKYFFEFGTLKTADATEKYYKVLFSKLETVASVTDLIEITPAQSPFVLTYSNKGDDPFNPIRVSSAEINIMYPHGSDSDIPTPDRFFIDNDNQNWRVQLIEMTSGGMVESLKWQGFLLNSDFQYEWQNSYYYRMTAVDNLSILKDQRYRDIDSEYLRLPPYNPMEGINLKDFIISIVNFTGNALSYKFACTYKFNGSDKTLEELFTSVYSAVDWKQKERRFCFDLLQDLLKSIGCIIYLDNSDCTWTIISPHEVSTRTDNLVPYDAYSNDGTYSSSGDIDLSNSINTGESDLVWSDKNQIVSLNRSYSNVLTTCEYEPKNLVRNFSFSDENTGVPSFWDEEGTFTYTVEDNQDYSQFNEQKFSTAIDTLSMKTLENENNNALIDYSNHVYTSVTYTDTPLEAYSDRGRNVLGFYVTFNIIMIPSTDPYGAADSEGMNFQIINNAAGGNKLFEYSQRANIDAGGVWNTSVYSRVPVFYSGSDDIGDNIAIECLTPTTRIGTQTFLTFLKYRKNPAATGGGYYIDSVTFSLINQTYRKLKSYKYIASKNEIGSLINDNDNSLNLKFRYFSSFKSDIDWYLFETSIGAKLGTPEFLSGSNLFYNFYESGTEQYFKPLQSLVSKNIMNFYSLPSRKFVGNVYGEEIKYFDYFKVKSTINKSANEIIAENYEDYVLSQVGEVETSACGTNALDTYNIVNANFFMSEAVFDYSQSKTKLTILEDNTSRDKVVNTWVYSVNNSGGVLPEKTGSNSQEQNVGEGEDPTSG